MHAYTALGMLALAGAAMANPVVVYETAVVTVIVGPDGQPINNAAAAPTPAPEPQQGYHHWSPPQYQAPEPTPSPSPEPVQPSPEPAYQPAPSSQPQYQPAPTPQPSPEPSPSPAPAPSTDSGYMGIVNTWRAKLGLPDFEHDSTLEANALKTCDDGNGEMKHELNPGSFGQVLAPGQPDEFEHVYVGGWLCERPNEPGMDGVCGEQSKGWMYDGTGHADILMNKDYKKIGCSNAKGIWGCDVA